MNARVPRSLMKKRAALAQEREKVLAQLDTVDFELAAVDFAIRVVSPGWQPPARIPQALGPDFLAVGTISETCLQVLRGGQELVTKEIARLIATRHRLQFANRAAELDFAGSVATALRRHQRRGILTEVGKDKRTGVLCWRLNTGADGRMKVVKAV